MSSVGAEYLRESSGSNTPDVTPDAALDVVLEVVPEAPLAATDAVELEAFGVTVGEGLSVAARVLVEVALGVTVGNAVAVACTGVAGVDCTTCVEEAVETTAAAAATCGTTGWGAAQPTSKIAAMPANNVLFILD